MPASLLPPDLGDRAAILLQILEPAEFLTPSPPARRPSPNSRATQFLRPSADARPRNFHIPRPAATEASRGCWLRMRFAERASSHPHSSVMKREQILRAGDKKHNSGIISERCRVRNLEQARQHLMFARTHAAQVAEMIAGQPRRRRQSPPDLPLELKFPLIDFRATF